MIPDTVFAAPLAGRHVLVTRPARQAVGVRRALEDLGAKVTTIPTIRIVDPPDPDGLVEAACRLADYDWILLTSANGAARLGRAVERARTVETFRRARIAVIGPATAKAVADRGAAPAVIPRSYRAEALVEALVAEAGQSLSGARVLLARALEARPVLPDALAAAGATVDVVPAYATEVERAGRAELAAGLDSGSFDWLTFTASSTVRAYVELVGPRTVGARVAVIGPITAATARALGIDVDVEADPYTTAGLVQALADAAGRSARP